MHRVTRLVSLFLLGSASSCLSSGSSDNSSNASTVGPTTFVKKTIGPDGDSLLVSGATITIPKDALPSPLDITISTQAGEAAPDGFVALSAIFHCDPSGTSFVHAVTMKMPFQDDGKGATMFWSTNANPDFTDVGGTPGGGFMVANVSHFSSGFVGRKK